MIETQTMISVSGALAFIVAAFVLGIVAGLAAVMLSDKNPWEL